jgi:hypothetical protein
MNGWQAYDVEADVFEDEDEQFCRLVLYRHNCTICLLVETHRDVVTMDGDVYLTHHVMRAEAVDGDKGGERELVDSWVKDIAAECKDGWYATQVSEFQLCRGDVVIHRPRDTGPYLVWNSRHGTFHLTWSLKEAKAWGEKS